MTETKLVRLTPFRSLSRVEIKKYQRYYEAELEKARKKDDCLASPGIMPAEGFNQAWAADRRYMLNRLDEQVDWKKVNISTRNYWRREFNAWQGYVWRIWNTILVRANYMNEGMLTRERCAAFNDVELKRKREYTDQFIEELSHVRYD